MTQHRPRISFGPCHLVVRKGSGAVDIQKSKPKQPVYRLAIVRPSDGRVIVRWWAEKPSADDLAEMVLAGIRLQLPLHAPLECVVPATLVRSEKSLVARLQSAGFTGYLPIDAADAGVAQIRATDKAVGELIWQLELLYAEGPPTLPELNDEGSPYKGWAVLTGASDELTSWAARICEGRGRDPVAARERALRSPMGARVNQHVRAVAEEDGLDVYMRNSARMAPFYVPLEPHVLSAMRRWTVEENAEERDAIESFVAQHQIQAYVEHICQHPGARPVPRLVPPGTQIGMTWANRLETWIVRALREGVQIAADGWTTMCRLDVHLEGATEGRWIRDLPDKEQLRAAFAARTGASRVGVEVAHAIGKSRIGLRRVTDDFERICANRAKFDRPMSRQAMRVETLTPPKANPVARPNTLLCYVVAQGMPTPSNAAAVDLGGWIRSANVQLDAWAAACRIRSAALSLLSVENKPQDREIIAAG